MKLCLATSSLCYESEKFFSSRNSCVSVLGKVSGTGFICPFSVFSLFKHVSYFKNEPKGWALLIFLYFLSYFQSLSFCSTFWDFNYIVSIEFFIKFFFFICSFFNSILFLFHGYNIVFIPFGNINNSFEYFAYLFLLFNSHSLS